MMKLMASGQAAPIRIRHELRTGDLGRLIALHGVLYDRECGWGVRFEAFVAATVAEYVLDNACRGRVWLAEREDELVGCAAVAERPDAVAQLRWVLLDPAARGSGLGRRLVRMAMAYAVERGCSLMYLHTTDGLDASRTLYDSLGFTVVAEEVAELWDGKRPLIRMERVLADGS